MRQLGRLADRTLGLHGWAVLAVVSQAPALEAAAFISWGRVSQTASGPITEPKGTPAPRSQLRPPRPSPVLKVLDRQAEIEA